MVNNYTEKENEQLKYWCKTGNLEAIKKFTNGYKFYNNICFAMACKHKQKHVATWLHNNSSNINNYRNYEQALRNVIERQNNDMAIWIIEIDPDVRIAQDLNIIPIIAESNNLNLMEIILKHQPKLNDDIIITSFKLSMLKGHYDMGRLIGKYRSDVNLYISNLKTSLVTDNNLFGLQTAYEIKPFNVDISLYTVAMHYADSETCMWLYSINPDLDLTKNNDKLLRDMYTLKKYDQLHWLLEKTGDQLINVRYAWACKNNHLLLMKCIRTLNPKHSLCFSNNLLMNMACKNNYLEIVDWLYDEEPTINLSNNDDELFKIICYNSNNKILEWFLNANPDANIYIADGKMLKMLTNKGKYNMIESLYTFDNNIIDTICETHGCSKRTRNFIRNLQSLSPCSQTSLYSQLSPCSKSSHTVYPPGLLSFDDEDYDDIVNIIDEVLNLSRKSLTNTHQLNADAPSFVVKNTFI